ncbi:hypothetical protein [Actinokineospora pegani]|uniref:hypothetical protein n=1 Tax=Actinokineospora pegani TaxID=2654637 RepID=UPI0012E9F3B8|nr:hypothetical protein [Actinokineospora pegani]
MLVRPLAATTRSASISSPSPVTPTTVPPARTRPSTVVGRSSARSTTRRRGRGPAPRHLAEVAACDQLGAEAGEQRGQELRPPRQQCVRVVRLRGPAPVPGLRAHLIAVEDKDLGVVVGEHAGGQTPADHDRSHLPSLTPRGRQV